LRDGGDRLGNFMVFQILARSVLTISTLHQCEAIRETRRFLSIQMHCGKQFQLPRRGEPLESRSTHPALFRPWSFGSE
jgi:hypothetical protein